jgi:hypothetical protein
LLVSRGSGCIELDLPSPPSSEGGFFAFGLRFSSLTTPFCRPFFDKPGKMASIDS